MTKTTYSHEYYLAHKDHIRAVQKKYYESHKHDIVKKYKHCRTKWNDAHRAYLNEHARLAREIRLAGTVFDAATPAIIKKDYLRELHVKGMI